MAPEQEELFSNAPSSTSGSPQPPQPVDVARDVAADAASNAASNPAGNAAGAAPAPAPVWLQRLNLVIMVIFCFYIGALLIVLPWIGRYWLQNGWFLSHPEIAGLAQHGWLRGVVSGLGALDIWIGLSELIHYRDYRV